MATIVATTIAVEASQMAIPPPSPAAVVLPDSVPWVTLSVPSLAIPPPFSLALLPESVLSVTLAVPWLPIPPPQESVLLPDSVLPMTLTAASLSSL